jgi:uncharacterized protein YjdB
MKRDFDLRVLGLLLSISTLLGVGCSDTDAPETEGWFDGLILGPANRTVERGDSFQLGVERVQEGRSEFVTANATWTLSDPAIAEVSPAGLLVATQSGTARITAQVDGLAATTSVYVLGRPVDIQLSPLIVRLAKGTSTRLSTTIISEDNTKRAMSGDEAWASSDLKVAEASGSTVKGVAAGEATVVLSRRGQIFSRLVSVLDVRLESIVPGTSLESPIVAGQRVSLFAEGVFTGGHKQDVSSSVEFRLASEESGTVVTLANGVVTAVKPGQAVIDVVGKEGTVATGIRAQLTVAVLEAPSSIEVLGPTKASLKGEPLSIQVRGTSGTASRNVSSLATITAEPAGIMKVSGTTITPLKAGEVKLTAQVGTGTSARQASLPLTVVDASLSSLAINLPEGEAGTVAPGEMLALAGVATFQLDITQTVTQQVLWLSDNPAVAVVDNAGSASGRVTGLSEGTATIKAYYRGQLMDSKTITVSP